MSGSSRNQMSVLEALERARSNANGEPNAQANQVLNQAHNEIWQRIQARPNTYVMTQTEFAVMLRFSARHQNNTYRQAVSRYWDNQHSNSASGASNSNSI